MTFPKVQWFNIFEDVGCFWMFFNHLPPTKVGLAKSLDGVNFEVVKPAVMRKGFRFLNRWGSWDSILIESHSTIRLKNGWRMFFGGYNGHWRIGYADSHDLLHWRKHGLILDLGEESWESIHAADPHVVDFDGKRLMYYMGKGKVWQVGVAIEQEGRFVRYQKNPIITANRNWNRGCMCLSGVLVNGDELLGTGHGYDPLSKKFRGHSLISKDGFAWKEAQFLGEGIIHPEIHYFNGKPILYYTDTEYNFQSRSL